MLPPSKLGPKICSVFPEIARFLTKGCLEYRSMLGLGRAPMLCRPELQCRDDTVIDAAYRELAHIASNEVVK